MIVRSYNPVERGQPAIWLEGVIEERGPASHSRISRLVREFPGAGPVDIVVDSPGGRCTEALRIYNALRDCPRPKRMTLIRASSAASLVAMAGDHNRMMPGGTVYLHPPGGDGNAFLRAVNLGHLVATDLRRIADRLDAFNAIDLDIYQRRTGQPRELLSKLCEANTTLDAHEAVQLGFADEIVETSE